jgi:hypothetical protein
VLENEVLNVDSRLAELAKESPKRTGFVRNENLNLGVARRGTAMLAGNAGDTLVTCGHDAINGSDAPTAQRPQLGGGIQVRKEIIEIASKIAQNRCHGPSIPRQDGSPEARVRTRDTRGIA